MLNLRRLLRLPSKLKRKARRSRLTLMLLLLIIPLLLIAPLYVIYKPPHLLITYFQQKWPRVLWHVPTSKKIIALTVDDAPSEHTAEILDVLRENDATATLFVIGSQVEGREEILRDVIRSGNELGNHAMHDEPSRSLSDKELKSQINEVDLLISSIYASTNLKLPNLYFRPGSGFFSNRMLDLVGTMDYRLVLGSVYPHDAQISWWRVNAAHVLSMIRPGGIIICHDRRGWTADMLRKVLPEVRRRGYRIVSVSELLRETEL